MKEVMIFTDGACSGNPGPGGWGAVLVYNGHEKELTGGFFETTNNRMELMAVIKGLEAIKEPCIVELYSDSRYVIDALRLGWAKKWKSNNWIRSGNTMAANADLWDTLLKLTDIHTVHYHWVKGHATNPKNNRWAITKWPLIRGVFNFIDSMVFGMKCLMKSAEMSGMESLKKLDMKLKMFIAKPEYASSLPPFSAGEPS